MADALSWVTTHLQTEVVQAILDGATVGSSQRAEGENPAIIENDQQLEKGSVGCCWASPSGNACHQLGSRLRKRTPSWMQFCNGWESRKKTDLRTLLWECIMSEEGSICAPPPKGRMRICCSLWYPRCIKLPP